MESIKNIFILINIYRELLVGKLLIVLNNQMISLAYNDLTKSIDANDIKVFIDHDEKNDDYKCINIIKGNIRAEISFNHRYDCYDLVFTYYCEESDLSGCFAYTPEEKYFLGYDDVCSIINQTMGNIIH